MKAVWIAAAVALFCGVARAEVKTETVKFKAGQVESQSVIVYDDAASGAKKPGVVVVPEWWGLDDYAKTRAKMLAGLGYVALAVDVYGDARHTDDPKQAGQWATALRGGDRKELRARVNAALAELKKNPHVDPQKTAAIGYCFGGTTALELARSGADVAGVVSFHGDLSVASPAQNLKAKVLVCHGGDDGFEPPQQVMAFQDEMRQAHADWQFNTYGGAVHGFTNPAADAHHIPGMGYNKEADERSWQAMKDFFAALFGPATSASKAK